MCGSTGWRAASGSRLAASGCGRGRVVKDGRGSGRCGGSGSLAAPTEAGFDVHAGGFGPVELFIHAPAGPAGDRAGRGADRAGGAESQVGPAGGCRPGASGPCIQTGGCCCSTWGLAWARHGDEVHVRPAGLPPGEVELVTVGQGRCRLGPRGRARRWARYLTGGAPWLGSELAWLTDRSWSLNERWDASGVPTPRPWRRSARSLSGLGARHR